MAKPHRSSTVFNPSNLGFHALVFDEADVVRLLTAAVEREGGQTAFAKHHGINRAYMNSVLRGKKGVSDSVIKALGLRKVYIAE